MSNLTIGESSAYLREVKEQVYDVLSLCGNFKFNFQVPELKVNFSTKFKAYHKEKARVEMAISNFNNLSEETLQKLLAVKLFDVINLKKDLKGALKEVVNAAIELKFVAKKARLILDHELASI